MASPRDLEPETSFGPLSLKDLLSQKPWTKAPIFMNKAVIPDQTNSVNLSNVE